MPRHWNGSEWIEFKEEQKGLPLHPPVTDKPKSAPVKDDEGYKKVTASEPIEKGDK